MMKKHQWLRLAAWGAGVLLGLKSLLWLCSDWNQLLLGLQWSPVSLLLDGGDDWGAAMTVVTAVLRLAGMAGVCLGLLMMTRREAQRGSRIVSLSLLLAMIPDALALAPALALGVRFMGGSQEWLGMFWIAGMTGLALMRVIWLSSVSQGFWMACRFSRLAKMMTAFALAANVVLCLGFWREYPLGLCVWLAEGFVMVCMWMYGNAPKQDGGHRKR